MLPTYTQYNHSPYERVFKLSHDLDLSLLGQWQTQNQNYWTETDYKEESQCVISWFDKTIVNTGIRASRIHLQCITPICFQELMKQPAVHIT